MLICTDSSYVFVQGNLYYYQNVDIIPVSSFNVITIVVFHLINKNITIGQFHMKSTSAIHHILSDCTGNFFTDSTWRVTIALFLLNCISKIHQNTNFWKLAFLQWPCDILLTNELWVAITWEQKDTEGCLPRWLRWLRHSVHRPGRSVGGAVVHFPGQPVDFVFGFQGRHALRFISRQAKRVRWCPL